VFEHDYQRYPELTNAQLEVLGLSSPHEQITEDFHAKVVKVHDGDTVTLRASFRDFDFPLRLLDIDAPEMNEGGLEAKEWLSSRLLFREVDVLIDSSNRVGKYGRLLGRILSDGLIVGDEMVHLGLVARFGKKNEGAVPRFDRLMEEAKIE